MMMSQESEAWAAIARESSRAKRLLRLRSAGYDLLPSDQDQLRAAVHGALRECSAIIANANDNAWQSLASPVKFDDPV